MIISRGLAAARLLKSVNTFQNVRSMSGHTYVYRVSSPPVPKHTKVIAELLGGLMWWWIFWHLWHESEHITGEFEYPNPAKWTDEELGL